MESLTGTSDFNFRGLYLGESLGEGNHTLAA